jgi:hypothetical protein
LQIRLTPENLKKLKRLRRHQSRLYPDVDMSINKQVNVMVRLRLDAQLSDFEKEDSK